MILNIKEKLKRKIATLKDTILDPNKPFWIFCTLILMGLVLLILQNKNDLKKEVTHGLAEDSKIEQITTPLDTYIPAGYVLVALQLVNLESISSILGNYGMVDLYPVPKKFNYNDDSNSQIQKTKPIGNYLRIFRSPNNPQVFGALIPENEREMILQLSDPVLAVIHNSTDENKKSEIQNQLNEESKKSHPTRNTNKRLITYGDFK